MVPRIHHISCGTLCPFGGSLINDHGSIFERARMVCHCLLIEGEDGLVLVDTGLGTADMTNPLDRLGKVFTRVTSPELRLEDTALHQTRALGFEAKDVRHIIPTHLDLDHVGGLSDFPDAEVHVFAPEHAAAMNPPTLPERERYRSIQFRHRPHFRIYNNADGEDWFGFSRVRALAGSPEILLIPLVGHTRGHVGVAVRAQVGWILHAGDAYFSHREMKSPPSCPPALAFFQRIVAINDRKRRESRDRLNELVQREPGIKVFSAHCPVEYENARM